MAEHQEPAERKASRFPAIPLAAGVAAMLGCFLLLNLAFPDHFSPAVAGGIAGGIGGAVGAALASRCRKIS